MIGKTLGHYHIVEKIGAGGMGEVYRARDERLDRDVALKVLPAGTLADEAARKRFRKEALALSKLNHPNIGTVHDFDTQDGVDFLVMEHIAGATLDQKLAAGPVAEKEIVRLGAQLAEGLVAAHQQGVVHRDLKPGNLRVTPDGWLKILDFGLAKLLRPVSEAATESFTETQAVAGTLPYMAPEQLRGEKADARSDLYSLGVVLYEMATGRRPFQETLSTALTDAILHKPPPPPGRLQPELSARLEEIILKCLEKDPEHRYQSARELLADFRRLGAPTTAPTARPRAARISPRVAVMAAGTAAALLAAVLVGFNVGGLQDRLLGRAGPPQIQSLAVLPLENLSRDPEQEYFADGMTEALITELSKISALKVISRTSVMQYKGVKKPLPQIARELNVDAVVEGSVLREGDQVRVTVQLIHGATDRHLWAESYQREMRSILALQSEVARAIAEEIRGKLTAQEQVRLAGTRQVSPKAYEAYLRGKFFFHKRSQEVAENEAALRWFERATELDPEFALAYAALAQTYIARFFSYDPQREWEERAFVAIEKALSLDPNLAEAYVARGDLAWTLANHFPHERAIQDYRRALALNHNLADAHFSIGSVYFHIGLLDKSLKELQAAVALDPHNVDFRYRIPRVYLYQQQYEAALSEFERNPEWPSLWQWQKALALFYLGRREEALALIGELSKKYPEQEDIASTYAVILAARGQKQRAEEQIRIAIKSGQGLSHFHHAAYNIASAYALMGNNLAAMAWLEKAADEGLPCYPLFDRDPNLESLRRDPRFVTFMTKLKSQWERYKATL